VKGGEKIVQKKKRSLGGLYQKKKVTKERRRMTERKAPEGKGEWGKQTSKKSGLVHRGEKGVFLLLGGVERFRKVWV